ncbi:hypothetical protein CGCSCA5_v003714 [Colletotrichum siamense]|nr:hypothetical protein CGCSCA5_v003714 [Colletotrichum siamense]
MDHHLELIFEILGGLAVAFIILVTLAIVWSEVVEVLVANPHQFIRHGRRLQTLLRLPRWLCVFSDTDPGLPDDHIYVIGTAALPWGAILVIITSWTLYLVAQRQVPSKWFWFSVLVFVLSVGCSWVSLLADQRRRAREKRAKMLADMKWLAELRGPGARNLWEAEESDWDAEGAHGIADGNTTRRN